MAEEKTLQQTAYDVGKGRVTSTQKMKTTNAIVNATNGIMDYVYKGFQVADEIKKAETATQDKAYDEGISQLVSDYLNDWEEQGLDDDTFKERKADVLSNLADASFMSGLLGGSTSQYEDYWKRNGQAITAGFDSKAGVVGARISQTKARANADIAFTNTFSTAENPYEAINSFTRYTKETNISAIDPAGNFDMTKPTNIARGGYTFYSTHIPDSSKEAVLSMSREQYVNANVEGYERFMSGRFDSSNPEQNMAYETYRDAIEEEAGKAYDSESNLARTNSISKNSEYQRLSYELMESNGFESPTLNEIYGMINQSGLDFSNPYDREYIQNILKGAGYTEEIIRNDKVRNAISSITDSDFLLPENKGLGVYDSSYGVMLTASGYTFTSSEKKADNYKAMAEAFASGRGIATNHQPMIDNRAEEYGIEKGSEDYKLLASGVIAKEVKSGNTPLDFNTQLINNLFYSNASDDEVRSLVASMDSYGAISDEDAKRWYDKIKDRQTVYTPFVVSAKNIADEYINGLELSTEEESKIINLYKNSPDADKNWEALIYSKSGSPTDMGQIRGLTIEEVEQYIDGIVDVYCSEKLAESQGAFEEDLIRALNGDTSLATPSFSDNENFVELYTKSLNGEYEQFRNKEAISNARTYLRNNDSTTDGLFDTVSESIYGKTYDELEDSEKNIVYINVNYSLASDAQVKDLYKVLYGSSSVNSEYVFRSNTSDPQILNNAIGKSNVSLNEFRDSKLPNFENLNPTKKELDSFKLGAKTKEVYIEGLGHGLMDSDGYVYAIMPTSYQSGNLQVIGFYYSKNSDEYRSVWSSTDEGATISIDGRNFFLHDAEILTESAPVEPGGNAVKQSSNSIGNGLANNNIFISKKKSLKVGGI